MNGSGSGSGSGLLTGWFRELARATGIRMANVRHTECRARADARCFLEIHWAGLEDGPAAPKT